MILTTAVTSTNSTGSFHSELISIDTVSRVIILPFLEGGPDSILEMVHRVTANDITNEQLKTALSLGETASVPQTLLGPKNMLIQLGGIPEVDSNRAGELYSNLFSLAKALGWRIFGLYGEVELSLTQTPRTFLSPVVSDVVHAVRQTFRYAVHIKDRRAAADYSGPGDTGTLFLSRSITNSAKRDLEAIFGPGIRKSLIEKLWYASESTICENVLPKLLGQLNVARIFIHADTGRSLCGSRLVEVTTDGPIVLNLSGTLSMTQFNPQPETLWPRVPKVDLSESEFEANDFDRIFVMPDIHGDLFTLVRTLWMIYNEIVPLTNRETWDAFKETIAKLTPMPIKNGRIALVQLGDIIDRGPFTKECIQVIMGIEELFGWKLIPLYGNHELMNFNQMASSYVHPEDDLQGNKRRHLFSITGPLWRRLTRKLVIAARFKYNKGGILAIHAGINMGFLNQRSRIISQTSIKETSPVHSLNVFSRYVLSQAADLSPILQENDSPVWTRDFETLDEATLCNSILPPIKAHFNVNMIIVGHTPQKSRRVRVRCGGQILLADTAMSEWMGFGSANPTAVDIEISGGGDLARIRELHYVAPLNDVLKTDIPIP